MHLEEIHISLPMSSNLKKAKELLERLEKDDAPASISSIGYMNPMFTPMSEFKQKKKKKLKGYVK